MSIIVDRKKRRIYEQNLNLFKTVARMNKNKLQFFLCKLLKEYGYTKIVNTNMYLMAEGDLPICLCAHMDTVFTNPPRKIYYDRDAGIAWSPSGMGADDRAGITIILKILQDGFRPSLVFTDLEEKGGVGADSIVSRYADCPFKECKALIQLDRRGVNDSVYYDCDNVDFEKKINSYGFETNWGSFSDISVLAPIWGVAAVNLSVGYENEHTTSEILSIPSMDLTYIKLKRILRECEDWPSYSYIPSKTRYSFSNLFNLDGFEDNNVLKDEQGNILTCVCCGKPLKDYYYNYKYDNETFRVCPDCYEVCFCPGPLDE